LLDGNGRSRADDLLVFDDVDFAYPDARKYVVYELAFRVRHGEFVSLLGPSGCGKTTIMNLAAGLLSPTRGEVVFDDERITGVNTSVGYMTQTDSLLPWRSVDGNLRLPLDLRHVARATADRLVAEQLELMRLEGTADLFPSQLSGGMKRRALLARSLIYEPKMVLMDEPFAAVDAQMRARLQREMWAAARQRGQAVLFITHDIREAALISDRVITLAANPARVVEDRPMPFGRDRDLRSVEFSQEYARECEHLWALLGERDEATLGDAR